LKAEQLDDGIVDTLVLALPLSTSYGEAATEMTRRRRNLNAIASINSANARMQA
jgi:hypothetical protein